MFLNKEDAEGQQYEFVHNTVYNFTGTGPIKLFCLSSIVGEVHPISTITIRNNIFALGQNAEIFDQYGYKKFYGNTNGKRGFTAIILDIASRALMFFQTPANTGITGMECMVRQILR